MDFLENREFYEEFTPVLKHTFVPQESQVGKLRHGLVKRFGELNSGMFGKDYTSGLRWTEQQVREKTSFLDGVNESHLTNMLAKQGKLITETEQWSDNILNKIDVPKLQELYKEMNNLAKTFKMEMTNDNAKWIEEVMGRSTFTIPEDKFVMKILNPEFRVWEEGSRQDKDTQKWTGREAMATDDYGATPGKLYRFVKDLPFTPSEYQQKFGTKSARSTKGKKLKITFARQKFRSDLRDDKLTNAQRRRVVEEVLEQAQDYILTNDMHDMVSLKLMSALIKKNRDVLTDDVIKDIHMKVQEIKDNSYLANKERMKMEDFYESNTFASEEVKDAWSAVEKAQKKPGIKKVESEGSAKMDQMQSDKVMRDYKKTLNSSAEKRLFDYLMLGSYNRAKKTIAELPIGNVRDVDANVTRWYKYHGARTSMMKLGFSSEAIPPTSVRAFLKEYMKLTGKTLKRNESELKKLQNLAQTLDKKTVRYEQEEVPFIEDRTPKK